MIPNAEVLAAYDLAIDNLVVAPINNGLINSTWLIKNSHRSFILQKVNDNVFKNPEAIASNIRLIADFLSKHNPGYLFASPIQTKNHEEMKYIRGSGYYRLIPFVENSHTITTVEKPEQAFEAAKKFGEFTQLLSGFPVEKLQTTLPDFHNLTLRYQQFLDALETGNKARIRESKELIEFIKVNKNIVDIYEDILQNPSFKLRVTHHDTKISNVLFDKKNNGLCVIDLDTVMPGYFISDVGDMMRTYLSEASEEETDLSKIKIRKSFYRAIFDGYMKEMSGVLTAEEKSLFTYSGKFIIYMQAIRFLTDYLENDKYYG